MPRQRKPRRWSAPLVGAAIEAGVRILRRLGRDIDAERKDVLDIIDQQARHLTAGR